MEFKQHTAFIERITSQLGTDATEFLNALSADPAISVRKNTMKHAPVDLSETHNVPWCNAGVYLSEKPVFTLDPLFHAGCYYPQEASSMIIDWVVRDVCKLPENPKVLDLCGAPGGKSTLLASWLSGNGLLVANEVIRNRAVILSENMIKWGAPNCIVTRNEPSDFAVLDSFFDLMVVDAPCSGEGMFRKDVRAVEEWSEGNAAMCAQRQRRILTEAWPALQQGGYLIYSTCTFNPAENEENVSWFSNEFGAEVQSVIAPEAWGLTSIAIGNGNGLAFYPNRVKGEGFFIAVLQKTATDANTGRKERSRDKRKGNAGKLPVDVSGWLQNSREWCYYEERAGWRAFPMHFKSELQMLKSALGVLNYGVLLGQPMKNMLIPAHELALSTALNRDAFIFAELQKQEALRYLKGESLSGQMVERGYVIVAYKNLPLGFVKNIGTRMNNLYPSEWRIRMALPE
ncbi:methyltransferase RsmF C-terminal domain-like protein [Alkaliflexus imshenetskii]|uniref:methyltransferase RsmF C-terminal domain-like protein n=1 Tax=Alkaliflexus imshenetskii TaxID=286730 RepID=UPI0004AC6DFA|nr:hypothetical protein [Alkaliflexus imshenetskii]